MNKFKLVLWLIILGIIALVIFQNQAFFLGSETLRVNPWVAPEYQTAPIPVAAICLIFFIFGLLLAYIFGVPEKFRNRKAIKRLNAVNASQTDEIDNLKKEINSLRAVTAPGTDEGQQLTAEDGSADGPVEDPNRPADDSTK